MYYDIIILKATEDAGSEGRIEQARAVVADLEAPRRALIATEDRSSTPDMYLGAMNVPGVEVPEPASWIEDLHDTIMAVVGSEADLVDLDQGQRVAVFDALPARLKQRWIEQFRSASAEWLEVAASYAEPGSRTRLWQGHVEEYPTVDGGMMLVCSTAEGDYEGPPSWFEAVQFLLPEVAEAAGFTEAAYFDVR